MEGITEEDEVGFVGEKKQGEEKEKKQRDMFFWMPILILTFTGAYLLFSHLRSAPAPAALEQVESKTTLLNLQIRAQELTIQKLQLELKKLKEK